MISYKEKLNKVTTFMFDVDGVLTNGDVMLLDNEAVCDPGKNVRSA